MKSLSPKCTSGLARSKENNDPFVLAVGKGPDNINSMVVVCKKKVITKELGRSPFVGLVALPLRL